MNRYHIKAPCGAIFESMSFADDATFEAYQLKLAEDHQNDGQGCHACKPQYWVVPRPRQPPHGPSSLLDLSDFLYHYPRRP